MKIILLIYISIIIDLIVYRKKYIAWLRYIDKTIAKHTFAAKKRVLLMQRHTHNRRNRFISQLVGFYTICNIVTDMYDHLIDFILHGEVIRKYFPLTYRMLSRWMETLAKWITHLRPGGSVISKRKMKTATLVAYQDENETDTDVPFIEDIDFRPTDDGLVILNVNGQYVYLH